MSEGAMKGCRRVRRMALLLLRLRLLRLLLLLRLLRLLLQLVLGRRPAYYNVTATYCNVLQRSVTCLLRLPIAVMHATPEARPTTP